MKRLNVNVLKPMLTALFLFLATILSMGPMTRSFLDAFWLKPGVTETIGLSMISDIIQGSIVQRKAILTQDILPVYGSSELASGSEFNGSKVFNGKPTGFTPFMIGRGHYQCLMHGINIGGQADLNNKKIVIFLMIDWFSSGGLASDNLDMNFSPLQVYQLLFNHSLPDTLKQSMATRILQFPEVLKNYPLLQSLLKADEHPGFGTMLSKIAIYPAARLDYASLQLQDTLRTIKTIKQLDQNTVVKNDPDSSPAELLPLDKLRKHAIKKGKSLITNPYGIIDTRLAELVNDKEKGSSKNIKMSNSTEYQDLELLLEILQAEGLRPLFIISPANGPYYDFTGFPVSERQQHYQRLREMLGQYGFEVADLSSHEYDPYYMQDPWHLGWKGWVDVDEILDNFYHDKKVL